MSEEEKINRLLNSIAKGCDGSIADEVKAIIIRQQKEIKKEKNRIMELAELLDKQENEIKFLKGELEIQEGCSISKDKIKEKIKEQRQKYFDVHDGKHSINEICFESTKVEGAVEVLKELLDDGDHIPRID